MNKITVLVSSCAALLLPLITFAGEFDAGGDLRAFAVDVIQFINGTLVPFLLTLALLYFIYGVYKYFISGGGDDDARKEGRSVILWAIIAFVVIVSIWGIVNLVASGFGLSDDEELDFEFTPVISNPGA